MGGQHNVWATARENTGQNTYKGHIPIPRIEIKISDPTMNRTWAAGLVHYRPRQGDWPFFNLAEEIRS